MKPREYGMILVALLAVSAALWGWFHPHVVNVPGPRVMEYSTVEVPKPYAVITRQTMTVEKIVVMEKVEIVEKEKWPAWFTGDPNQQLTAIGIVQPWRGKTECASVINVQSGVSQIVIKPLPVPLFGFDNTMRAGFTVGLGYEAHAEWSFARIGSLFVVARGQYAQNGADRAMVAGVGVNYEW
jgi:hypothetical protein